jgi:hypothetical protein
MPTTRRATIEDLRLAIDCLPRTTRIAMLDGIRSNEIIVGAYSHGGGICPMLAAHRAGGRTNLISFARAWDRFAYGHSRRSKPRRATDRELRVLATHLEASLLAEEVPDAILSAAISAHEDLLSRRPPVEQPRAAESRPRPGDPDRTRELRTHPGWRWLRVFRRYDEYQWALAEVRALQDSLERERDAELVG